MVEEKEKIERLSGGVRVEAISPESMEKFAVAMKEAPISRLREILVMEPAIDKLSVETVDKMATLAKGIVANGGCGFGCF